MLASGGRTSPDVYPLECSLLLRLPPVYSITETDQPELRTYLESIRATHENMTFTK
jgi:hypothetical protein